jgi:DNA repair protein RAD50
VEKVEGFDKYERALHGCQKKLQELSNKQAHSEGRRGGLIEQIRSLKRKLKSEDYNDIDERHRIVVIKHETTQIAVSDLEKYHSALDNALLRYHGIKIEEINRIIRELWNLTYKGEDNEHRTRVWTGKWREKIIQLPCGHVERQYEAGHAWTM